MKNWIHIPIGQFLIWRTIDGRDWVSIGIYKFNKFHSLFVKFLTTIFLSHIHQFFVVNSYIHQLIIKRHTDYIYLWVLHIYTILLIFLIFKFGDSNLKFVQTKGKKKDSLAVDTFFSYFIHLSNFFYLFISNFIANCLSIVSSSTIILKWLIYLLNNMGERYNNIYLFLIYSTI